MTADPAVEVARETARQRRRRVRAEDEAVAEAAWREYAATEEGQMICWNFLVPRIKDES